MPGESGVTIVIPAYNEEAGIAAGIDAVEQALETSGWKYEIIVVDDGSTDATARLAAEHGVEVVRLGANRGYGAALKAGIALAKFPWVAIIDADATYPAWEFTGMLQRVESNDMVVGARIGSQVRDPLARRPAKWILRKFAGMLAGQHIPDLNSGMRVIRKSLVGEFASILPSGFSFTTTITLAMICSGYSVAYVPIDYFKRVGRSKIKPFHALKFAFLIFRTILLFRPVRVLAPVSLLVILAGLLKLAFDLQAAHVSASAGIILLQGILIWCIALVAGRNVRLRQSKR
jgi:glycosyltransferase involved in cell wall biosynthesis